MLLLISNYLRGGIMGAANRISTNINSARAAREERIAEYRERAREAYDSYQTAKAKQQAVYKEAKALALRAGVDEDFAIQALVRTKGDTAKAEDYISKNFVVGKPIVNPNAMDDLFPQGQLSEEKTGMWKNGGLYNTQVTNKDTNSIAGELGVSGNELNHMMNNPATVNPQSQNLYQTVEQPTLSGSVYEKSAQIKQFKQINQKYLDQNSELYSPALDAYISNIESGINQGLAAVQSSGGSGPTGLERLATIGAAADRAGSGQMGRPSPNPGITKEQYDALPSGSEYIAPDGTTRTKP